MKYCLVRHCLNCTQWGTGFYEEVVYMNKNVKNMTYEKAGHRKYYGAYMEKQCEVAACICSAIKIALRFYQNLKCEAFVNNGDLSAR